jgi:hypothetical protein
VHFDCGQFWKYLKSLREIYACFEPNLDPTSDKKKMLYTTQERLLRREEAVVGLVARKRACWRGKVQ